MTSDNDILFYEKQQFRQWWIWLLLAGINAPFVAGVIKQIGMGQPFGDKPMSNANLICATATIVLLTIFLLSIRLETTIKPDGIYVQFFPFHFKYKYFSWSSLTKSYVRQYSPIADYGGWGLGLACSEKSKHIMYRATKACSLNSPLARNCLSEQINPKRTNHCLNKH